MCTSSNEQLASCSHFAYFPVRTSMQQLKTYLKGNQSNLRVLHTYVLTHTHTHTHAHTYTHIHFHPFLAFSPSRYGPSEHRCWTGPSVRQLHGNWSGGYSSTNPPLSQYSSGGVNRLHCTGFMCICSCLIQAVSCGVTPGNRIWEDYDTLLLG